LATLVSVRTLSDTAMCMRTDRLRCVTLDSQGLPLSSCRYACAIYFLVKTRPCSSASIRLSAWSFSLADTLQDIRTIPKATYAADVTSGSPHDNRVSTVETHRYVLKVSSVMRRSVTYDDCLSPVYTIQPVAKPVVKAVLQPGMTTGCIV